MQTDYGLQAPWWAVFAPEWALHAVQLPLFASVIAKRVRRAPGVRLPGCMCVCAPRCRCMACALQARMHGARRAIANTVLLPQSAATRPGKDGRAADRAAPRPPGITGPCDPVQQHAVHAPAHIGGGPHMQPAGELRGAGCQGDAVRRHRLGRCGGGHRLLAPCLHAAMVRAVTRAGRNSHCMCCVRRKRAAAGCPLPCQLAEAKRLPELFLNPTRVLTG